MNALQQALRTGSGGGPSAAGSRNFGTWPAGCSVRVSGVDSPGGRMGDVSIEDFEETGSYPAKFVCYQTSSDTCEVLLMDGSVRFVPSRRVQRGHDGAGPWTARPGAAAKGAAAKGAAAMDVSSSSSSSSDRRPGASSALFGADLEQGPAPLSPSHAGMRLPVRPPPAPTEAEPPPRRALASSLPPQRQRWRAAHAQQLWPSALEEDEESGSWSYPLGAATAQASRGGPQPQVLGRVEVLS